MAVRPSTFGRQMDRMKSGEPMEGAMKRGKHMASTMTKKDTYDKPSIGDKVILAMLRAKKKITGGGGKKPLTTERTQQITDSLKKAGMSASDIAKLKGKKK